MSGKPPAYPVRGRKGKRPPDGALRSRREVPPSEDPPSGNVAKKRRSSADGAVAPSSGLGTSSSPKGRGDGAPLPPQRRSSPRFGGNKLSNNMADVLAMAQEEAQQPTESLVAPMDAGETVTSRDAVPTAAASSNPDESTINAPNFESCEHPSRHNGVARPLKEEMKVSLAKLLCQFMRGNKLLFSSSDDPCVTDYEKMLDEYVKKPNINHHPCTHVRFPFSPNFLSFISKMHYNPQHYSHGGHNGIAVSTVNDMPLFNFDKKNMGAAYTTPYEMSGVVSQDVFTKQGNDDQFAILCPFCPSHDKDGKALPISKRYKFLTSAANFRNVVCKPDSETVGDDRDLTTTELCSGMRFLNHPKWWADKKNRLSLSGDTKTPRTGRQSSKLQNCYNSIVKHLVVFHKNNDVARNLGIFKRYEDECLDNIPIGDKKSD